MDHRGLECGLTEEMIRNSFQSCAVSLPLDGSEDEKISCFKPGRPCEAGRAELQRRIQLSEELAQQEDPFAITSQDVTDAVPEEHLIDADDSDEEDIDILA